ETLETDGKIRAWGVSNFDVEDLEQTLELVGPGAIACNQVLYNLDERNAEHRLQAFCKRRGIAFVGYSPLGSGNFPSPSSKKGQVLGRIGAACGVSPRAVALAYLTRSSFTIPKSSSPKHVRALAEAGDLVLDDEQRREIDAAFPLRAPKADLPYI